jgi:integral membrane protein (TIGR00529 family)
LFATITLSLVFLLMILLIRLRVPIGIALVIGAATTALTFGIRENGFFPGMGDAIGQMARVAVDLHSLRLLAIVLFIQFLGYALKHTASLSQLIGSLKALFRDRRTAMAVAPAFIGLMPMPGGALFSAPMVGELTDDLDVSPENRTVINFWFRHIWEWSWPLYPGLLFAADALAAPLEKILLAQCPLTVAAIGIGTVFCLRRVTLPREERPRLTRRTWADLAAAVWPVALIVAATATLRSLPALGIETATALLIALVITNPLFLLVKRVSFGETVALVRQTLQVRLLVLVYGVLAFGAVLKAYPATDEVTATLASWGVPDVVLIFCLPFLVGVLTGYQPGVVGTCFPLLAALIVTDGTVDYGRAAFAYAGGLSGVLLSPVHLCLVLSREYFGADLGVVYRRLAVLVGLLALAASGLLLLWPAVGLR